MYPNQASTANPAPFMLAQPPRRRPQPRLNGYASTSSLGQTLSSSVSSSKLASSRPRLPRNGSSLTPERTPLGIDTSPGRLFRTGSPGESFGESSSSRLGWNGDPKTPEDPNTAALLEAVAMNFRRLRDCAKKEDGKGKSPARGDEAWECITRITEMVKKSDLLRINVSVEDVLKRYLANCEGIANLKYPPFHGRSGDLQEKHGGI